MNAVQNRNDGLEEQVTGELPDGISVTKAVYEGPEIVVYTEDPGAFAETPELLQRIAVALQKRVTVRPDPAIKSPIDEAKEKIHSLIPDAAGVTELEFYEDTGEVIIEAERPGMVIGRGGEMIQRIAQDVGWNAEVLRTPPLQSSTVDNVRNFLKEERSDRREILERIGRQIHRQPTSDDDYVRVTALGCCREVGRAAFILSTPETRILVDCGDKPGSDDVPYLQIPEALGAGAHTIDAVVLTHAHLDHSALVPLLFKYGYDGPVYCTEPTRDLVGLLTLDYLKVASKQGRSPPYESDQIRKTLKHTITVDYDTVTEIAPDVRITMRNAGHILGSAVTQFTIDDGDHNVVFSGDIHYDDTQLFNGAQNQFSGAETLVLESTYGARDRTSVDQETAEKELIRVINETYEKGGKTLIPAFAVGRSQEIMLVLEEAMRDGRIPRMPIHLDGMIWEATAIHTAYPEFLRDEVRNRIFHNDTNPFLASEFNHIDGHEQERQQIRDGGPAIILSTSGMMTGGPIMSWLKHLAPEPDATLTFVGYQAQGTLGRQIQQGRDELSLDDQNGPRAQQRVPLNMDVETVDGFSGHGDRDELMGFVEEMTPQPNEILCVHGDENAVHELSTDLYHEFNIQTFTPKNLETHRFK